MSGYLECDSICYDGWYGHWVSTIKLIIIGENVTLNIKSPGISALKSDTSLGNTNEKLGKLTTISPEMMSRGKTL